MVEHVHHPVSALVQKVGVEFAAKKLFAHFLVQMVEHVLNQKCVRVHHTGRALLVNKLCAMKDSV